MRTTIDLPDPLLKHLKARAALEGRTLRDLVVELVEKGLHALDQVDARQRFLARPLVGAGEALAWSAGRLSNADLCDAMNQEDDERARKLMAGG
jgi:plasmid stability protein